MTVPVDSRRRRYVGNGVTLVFNGPMAYVAEHVRARIITDGVAEDVSGFTVERLGYSAGTRVTFDVAPASGADLLLDRVVPYSQDVDVTNQGAFLPETIEKGYDALCMQIQQVDDEVSGALKLRDWDIDGLGDFDARGNSISDLAPGSTTDDAATYGQVLDAIATAINDPNTELFLQDGAGAQLRTISSKLRDVVSAMDFGVVGNGVTDDSAAFAVALNAAIGKSLLIPAGATIACASRIEIPSNIRIYGGGTIKALPLAGATVQGFLHGAGLDDVTIEGITIDCNPAAQTHPMLAAMYLTEASNVRIANCNVVCSYSGIYVRAGSSDVVVSGNNIDNSYGSPTDAAVRHNPSIIVGADNAVISNNTVTGVMSTAVADSLIGTGITVGADGSGSPYRNVSVVGNVVRDTYTAIAASDITNLTISGNSLSNCRTSNHSQAVLATRCVSASIVGNSCFNVDFVAIALADCSKTSVSMNTIANDGSFLVGAEAGSFSGITSSAGDSNSIVGNTITVNGAASAIGGQAILCYGNNCTVANNTADMQDMATSVGVQVYGSFNKISGNTLRVSYIGIRMLLFGGVPTQYNTIDHNTVEVVGASASAIVNDASEGPNRYVSNYYASSQSVTATFTNNHYFNRDNGKDTVAGKAADYTLQHADAFKQITNAGASGAVVLSLPDATASLSNRPVGLVYKFYRSVNQALRIKPFGTNTIRGGAAGKYLELDQNAYVELVCLATNSWEVVSSRGTITYEP